MAPPRGHTAALRAAAGPRRRAPAAAVRPRLAARERALDRRRGAAEVRRAQLRVRLARPARDDAALRGHGRGAPGDARPAAAARALRPLGAPARAGHLRARAQVHVRRGGAHERRLCAARGPAHGHRPVRVRPNGGAGAEMARLARAQRPARLRALRARAGARRTAGRPNVRPGGGAADV